MNRNAEYEINPPNGIEPQRESRRGEEGLAT